MFKNKKKKGTKPRRILMLVKVKAFKPYDKSCRIKHTCQVKERERNVIFLTRPSCLSPPIWDVWTEMAKSIFLVSLHSLSLVGSVYL